VSERGRGPGPVGRAALGLIGVYQRWISSGTAAHCRFLPTCSAYAVEAIELHGAVRGTRLALARIGHCHPFHQGGYDPVPNSTSVTGDVGGGICS